MRLEYERGQQLHQFKDSEGRQWSLAMNIAQAKRIKDQLGLDFVGSGFKAVTELANDIGTTVDVIWLLCEAQCGECGLTDEQFGEALTGDVIDEALSALLQELTDFFPPRHRGVMRTILTRLQKTTSQVVAMAESKVDSPQMDQAMANIVKAAEAEIDQELNRLTAGSSSGNPLASPA
jgi:hypothetical protein